MICPYCKEEMAFHNVSFKEKRKNQRTKLINRETYICRICFFTVVREDNYKLKDSDLERLNNMGIEGCKLDNYLHGHYS